MITNAILFPLFSAACAFTHDLGSMIAVLGRQGFAGGILIPMASTMVLTKLPMHQQPSAASRGIRGKLRGVL